MFCRCVRAPRDFGSSSHYAVGGALDSHDLYEIAASIAPFAQPHSPPWARTYCHPRCDFLPPYDFLASWLDPAGR